MKTIKINNPSIAEEIRKQMKVATIEENGLMSKKQCKKVDGIQADLYLEPNVIIKTDSVVTSDRYIIFSIVAVTSNVNPTYATFYFLSLNNNYAMSLVRENISPFYPQVQMFSFLGYWHIYIKFNIKYGNAFIRPVSNITVFEKTNMIEIPSEATNIIDVKE